MIGKVVFLVPCNVLLVSLSVEMFDSFYSIHLQKRCLFLFISVHFSTIETFQRLSLTYNYFSKTTTKSQSTDRKYSL
jgi:hypothetical protein